MLKTIRLQIAILMLSWVSGCSQTPVLENPSTGKLANLFTTETNLPTEIRGVWKSDSYGWILDIDENGATLYDLTSSNCTKADALLESYETYFHTYTLNSNELGLSGVFYPYRYDFRRLEDVPTVCTAPPATTPSRVFEFFVETMTEFYAFFDERGVDWDDIVQTNRPLISNSMTNDELWKVLSAMLRPIDDGHITLREPDIRNYFPGRGPTMMSIVPLARARDENPQVLFEQWYADYFDQIEYKLLNEPAQRRGNDRIQFGLIGGNIGYINIRSMGGFTKELSWSEAGFEKELSILDSAIDEAIQMFADVDGVIIDVSDNSGGFGMFSDLIASRFTDQILMGNYRQPVHRPDLLQREPAIRPSNKTRYTGPVIIVGSNLTVSAGESFMLSLRQADNVRIAGEPTRGALSEVMTKTLPNGWELDLSNEYYLDAQQRLWEVKGVQPDIPLQIFNPDNLFDGHADAILQLAKILGETQLQD